MRVNGDKGRGNDTVWQRSRAQDWRGLHTLSFDALGKKRHSRFYLEVLKQQLDIRFDLRNITFQYIHAPLERIHALFNGIHALLEGIHAPLEGIHAPFERIHALFEGVHAPFERIHALIQKLLALLEAFKSPDIPHTGRKVGF